MKESLPKSTQGRKEIQFKLELLIGVKIMIIS